LRPEGYGVLGGYRAGSLQEIADQEPVHQGQGVCAECHRDIHDLHEKDIHFDVECEDCHGPGRDHVVARRTVPDPGPDAVGVMPKEYTLEGCLYCHRRLAARPRDFPQVDPVEHYAFLGVTEPSTRCVECHSPHEPIFLLSRVRDARIHPIISECTHCHEKTPQGDHRAVEGHPVIFTCRDCHPAVVEDFEARDHASLRCTACHLFHRENESAGRIMKNGNRRFCLLCHESRPFKDPETMPRIDVASHLGQAAELLELPRETLESDRSACLRCHRRNVHGPRSGR
jgi:hypothetical protein